MLPSFLVNRAQRPIKKPDNIWSNVFTNEYGYFCMDVPKWARMFTIKCRTDGLFQFDDFTSFIDFEINDIYSFRINSPNNTGAATFLFGFHKQHPDLDRLMIRTFLNNELMNELPHLTTVCFHD